MGVELSQIASNRLIKIVGLYVLFCVSIISLLIFYGQVVKAAADTCTWTGSGADTNISTAGNWSGCDNGNVPQDGDTLVFPSGPTNKAVTVNSDMGFDSITFSGSGYTVASAAFESLGVYSSLTISGNNNTFSGYVRLYPTTTATINHSGTGTSFSHYLVIQPLADNTDVVLNTVTDLAVPMISQTAVGVGSSVDTVTKSGAGTLDVTGTAISGVITSGGIHIEEGRWQCDSTNCLGNSANEIVLDEGGDADSAELKINHSGTVSNPITSATVTGENGSVIISASATLNGDITVTDSLNMFVTGSTSANIDSDIAVADGKNLVSYGSEGYATNAYDYGGIISGDGGLIIDNAHVTLSGMSNTYTGSTELNNAALLTVTNNNSQGAHTSGTTVNSGTTLEYAATSDTGFGEPITVSGTGVGGSYPGALVKTDDNIEIEGGVTLAGDTTMHNAANEMFEITSVISGDYELTLTGAVGAGRFSFTPGGNNTYGNTVVEGVQLELNGAGNDAIPGPSILTVNAVNGKTSYVWVNNDNVISDNTIINLNNDTSQVAGLVNIGAADTIGTISGDGTIFMADSNAQFNLGGDGSFGTFEGVVEGYTGSQFQIIDGTWTFSGDNTDVGNGFSSYYVNGGTFIADAINTSLGFSPFSISAGVLGGTDVIGPVSAYAGTIAPGNSPGCLNPAGDVAFTEFSTLSIQINGTTACTEYDFLSASGAIALNDAQLVIELPVDYVSHFGDEFMIVQGSVLAGTFAGLADGDTVTVGDHSFRINYTSREVILTDITTDSGSSDTESSSDTLANTGISQLFFAVVSTVLLFGSVLVTKDQRL